jgi:hypothetical protein
MSNNYEEDYEEDYVKMIIQQIKETEEAERKINLSQSNSIIAEQDFEYEEVLKKDIEKEKLKNSCISKKIDDDDDEPDIPKTKEEMRKLRLEFFDKLKLKI